MKVTQKEIGKALGISERMVRRYKVRGMPNDSLQSAAEWYWQNCDYRSWTLKRIFSKTKPPFKGFRPPEETG